MMQRSPQSIRRRLGDSLAAAGLALLLGLGVFMAASRAADEERGVLADLISRALSTPASRVTIGRIDGALSSNATIHDIAIQDRDGVWLKLDRARIVWRRLALVQRRLEIDDLDLGQLTILRKPIPAETPVAGENQPLLPELPVKVDIKQFALSEMIVGQPILGIPARFSMGGYGTLGAPAEGLVLHLDGQRLDRPASLTVRLALVPEGQKLTMNVALDEPAGGLVSTLANIPGQPPVRLHLEGDGTLDAFAAKLGFDAGPTIAANGAATLTRQGAARRLGLDMSAQVSGLMPPVAAPVFADTTTLNGDVVFGDDGTVAIPSLALGAAAAQLAVTGHIDAARVADLTVKATNIPNHPASQASEAGATAVGDAVIRRLAFLARLTGPLDAPTVGATLSLEDARLPSGAVAKLEAQFSAVPTGALADTATHLRFEASATASGLALANPSLAQAVGHTATIETRGTSTLGGVIDIDALDLKAQTLSAHYAGRASAAELKGHLDADAPDLGRWGAVAGLDLAGSGHVSADVEGTPRSNRFTARVDARATHFASGVAPVDGLFGGTLALVGGVRLDPDGGFGFEALRLTGPNASAEVDGAATPALADVTARLLVPQLGKVDGRLSGRGDLTAHLTGTLDRPDVTASLGVTDAALMGRPVPHLEVHIAATDLRNAPVAHLDLTGEIDHKPAHARLTLTRPAGGGTVLEGLDATVGSVTLQGAVALDAAALAEGHLSVSARNLDDLSPLVLGKLAGSLDGTVVLSRRDGGQDGSVKASGQHIEAMGIGLDRLSVDLAIIDAIRHPVVNGTLSVDAARIGGETVSALRLTAKGTPVASDITLNALARGLTIEAQARVVPASPIRIALARFVAGRGRDRIVLERPTTVTLADGGADIRDLVLNLGGGRLAVEGRVGATLNLKATARAIPLSVSRIAAPDLGLAGMLDGEVTLAGSAAAPTGSYALRLAKVVTPRTRGAGLPPVDATASGRLEGARATLEASLKAAQAGTLAIKGSLPLGAAGALDLGVTGKFDAALANATIAAGGRRLTGAVAIEARVGGPWGHPLVNGAATLSDGAFADASIGIRLDALKARLVARGDTVTIENASGTTRNGGAVTASGQIRLDAAAGFPGTVRITAQKAQLVQSTLATAVTDLDLTISGPLARRPMLGGTVGVVTLDVPVPERLPGRLQPLPGTRHLNPTPTARARLALQAKAGRKAAPAFDMGLDLAITVPGAIHVYGRGLDAQLGGGLRLTGSLAKPRPVGAFRLVHGDLQVLTAHLDFSRANLTFAGDLSPELDFLATTQAGGASIGIAITGQPSDPQFDFTSNPDLPQDEILSRLLFGAPAGQLSTTQALSLASAAAQYSAGGNDALEGLRRSLGLGTASASNNPLTRALGNRVSVGVRTGVTPADTGVGVDVSVFGPLKVQGAVNATGGTSVGVGAEHEW